MTHSTAPEPAVDTTAGSPRSEAVAPHVGLELVNPKAQTRTVFLATAESTGGGHVEVEVTYPPNSNKPPKHLHPSQTEHFTLLSGTLHGVHGEEEFTIHAGDELVVEPGTPHLMWAGDDGVVMRWRTTPALRTGELYCESWQTARDNGWAPTPMQMFEVVQRHPDEFCLC